MHKAGIEPANVLHFATYPFSRLSCAPLCAFVNHCSGLAGAKQSRQTWQERPTAQISATAFEKLCAWPESNLLMPKPSKRNALRRCYSGLWPIHLATYHAHPPCRASRPLQRSFGRGLVEFQRAVFLYPCNPSELQRLRHQRARCLAVFVPCRRTNGGQGWAGESILW